MARTTQGVGEVERKKNVVFHDHGSDSGEVGHRWRA
jgi:hypothetical protein